LCDMLAALAMISARTSRCSNPAIYASAKQKLAVSRSDAQILGIIVPSAYLAIGLKT
jgi:hypothetical protein